MNSAERVFTALRREQPDRVPIIEFVVDEKVRRALFPDAEDVGAFSDAIGLDSVSCGLEFRVTGATDEGFFDEWGVCYRQSPEALSHPLRGPVRTKDDMADYQPPDPEAPWRLGTVPETVHRYKGKKAVILHHRAAFMWSAYLAGLDRLLFSFAADPEFAHGLMDKVLEANIAMIRRALKEGVDIVMLGDDYAHNHAPMMSPAHFKEFIFPRLKKMVDVVHEEGALCIKHSDGNIWQILDMIVDAGPDAVNPLEPTAGMDVGEVKKAYGDRVCIIGNVDCGDLLSNGTTAEVESAVKACIAKGGPGGGYILSSSNSIHSSVKPENYLAMVEAGREYGAYPLDEALLSG
jgi:uroporphyrinogen decarboxylase